MRGKSGEVFNIPANNCVVDVGADGRSMVLRKKQKK